MRRKSHYTLAKAFFLIFITLTETAANVYGQTPVANFSASVVSGCAPVYVQFTDQSTGNPFSWNWDLGNGQLSTLRNPVGNYTQPGTYTVRLIVRNAAGIDEEVRTNYIVVSPSPQAAFSADITTSCVPAS
ncbi:MAG TPA: PKD domain-containing protein, partial [Chitinophagaceae bacterium]